MKIRGWMEDHPGLDPRASYPGLGTVDALNSIADAMDQLADVKEFRTLEPLTSLERGYLRLFAGNIRQMAENRMEPMVGATKAGLGPGIYWQE